MDRFFLLLLANFEGALKVTLISHSDVLGIRTELLAIIGEMVLDLNPGLRLRSVSGSKQQTFDTFFPPIVSNVCIEQQSSECNKL